MPDHDIVVVGASAGGSCGASRTGPAAVRGVMVVTVEEPEEQPAAG